MAGRTRQAQRLWFARVWTSKSVTDRQAVTPLATVCASMLGGAFRALNPRQSSVTWAGVRVSAHSAAPQSLACLSFSILQVAGA